MGPTDIEKRAMKGGTSHPDLSELPARVPRVAGAELVTKYYFQVSPRTLERWPIPWIVLNGRAHCETEALIAEAQRRLAKAPTIVGGKQVT